MITVVGWDGSELPDRAASRLREASLVVAPDAVPVPVPDGVRYETTVSESKSDHRGDAESAERTR